MFLRNIFAGEKGGELFVSGRKGKDAIVHFYLKGVISVGLECHFAVNV